MTDYAKHPENDNASNVVSFPGLNYGPIEPDKILEGNKGLLKEVVVVGWDKDGEFVLGSSDADIRNVLHMLLKAQKFLLDLEDRG